MADARLPIVVKVEVPAEVWEAIADLRRRFAEMERIWAIGDEDRQVGLEDFAAAINRSPATIRAWWRDPVLRRRWHLEEVIRRDGARRLVTTPRAITRWRYATAERLRHPTREVMPSRRPSPRSRASGGSATEKNDTRAPGSAGASRDEAAGAPTPA